MPTYTFPPDLRLTPDSWGAPSMLTRSQLTELCLDIGTDPYTALTYTRLGEESRPIASAWYVRFNYYVQDGHTRCAADCIRVDKNHTIIDSGWHSIPDPPYFTPDTRTSRQLIIAALSR